MKLSNGEKCYYYKGTVYFPYLKARSKTAGLEFAAQVITTTGTADLQTWGQKKKSIFVFSGVFRGFELL